MRARGCALAVLLCLLARVGGAETVVEGWRSSFGVPRSVSVSVADGSLWAATGANVMHLAADGTVLGRFGGFRSPGPVAASPLDGGCWVVHVASNELVHLDADGVVVGRLDLTNPYSVAVSSRDGSVWATSGRELVHFAADGTELWRVSPGLGMRFGGASIVPLTGDCWTVASYLATGAGVVVRLAGDGTEVLRVEGLESPGSVAANGSDGSCWVTDFDAGEVIHLSPAGGELLRAGGFGGPGGAKVNADDGSCWFIATATKMVIHLSEDGVVLSRSGPYAEPWSLSLGPDGSCWVAASGSGQLIHLSASGEEVWRGGMLAMPTAVSVNPSDGTCWVADNDYYHAWVTRFSPGGVALWRVGGFQYGGSLSANTVDGTCWMADSWGNEVIHLAADGGELWRGAGFRTPTSVSVYDLDGSCWVADSSGHQLVHVTDQGADRWVPGLQYPFGVSVNQLDGTVWAADSGHGQIVHVAATGSELWRGGEDVHPMCVSARSVDGSCWAATSGEVWRLDATGSETCRVAGFIEIGGIATNLVDGSVWVADRQGDEVVHVSREGAELWRGGNFSEPSSVSVDAATGSCWVADRMNGQLVRLDLPDYEQALFHDVLVTHWAYAQVQACALAGIVDGFPDHTYRPTLAVTRDQMAVYIARGLAGGNANVPTGPAEPSFADVPADHWAYDYVEYCGDQDVVQGYPDGQYHPEGEVNRAQMAVYMARAVATPTGEAGVPEPPAGAEPAFPDVTAENDWAWCFKHVQYIAGLVPPVVHGYPDGTYRPSLTVTRDQMAVYVARAFELPL